ncbi:ABC transporter substrate-binding protein [Georgenia alba]|uniref:ABC transporter substrate-binding protein n=1 Tax=Georgenia alba TaxID=2233858 RepID=A0ABW2QAC6_9MICO
MRRLSCGLLALSVALATAACGASGAEEEAGGDDGLRQVTVGVIPILDVAPIYLGEQQGIFEEHGLDLEFQTAAGGAAIVPAVVSGETEIGFSNVTSLMLGRAQGLDLRAISAGASSTGDPESDYGQIVVPSDSDISDVGDLAGRTIAINTLNNINDTLIREAVDQAGGDASSIEFVEIPHPDMNAALEAGQVDAIWQVEPFLTMARQDGVRDVFALYADVVEDLTVATYFTTGETLESDPELVEAFTAAIQESLTYASEHPDETRAVLSEYTDIEQGTIEELTLPAFPNEINRPAVEQVGELGDKWGLFDLEAVDLETMLP